MRFLAFMSALIALIAMIDARRTGTAPKYVAPRTTAPSTRTTTTSTTTRYTKPTVTAGMRATYDPGRAAYGAVAYRTYISGRGVPWTGSTTVYMGYGVDYGYYGNY